MTKADKKVVAMTVKQNGEAFQFSSDEFKADKELVMRDG